MNSFGSLRPKVRNRQCLLTLLVGKQEFRITVVDKSDNDMAVWGQKFLFQVNICTNYGARQWSRRCRLSIVKLFRASMRLRSVLMEL